MAASESQRLARSSAAEVWGPRCLPGPCEPNCIATMQRSAAAGSCAPAPPGGRPARGSPSPFEFPGMIRGSRPGAGAARRWRGGAGRRAGLLDPFGLRSFPHPWGGTNVAGPRDPERLSRDRVTQPGWIRSASTAPPRPGELRAVVFHQEAMQCRSGPAPGAG